MKVSVQKAWQNYLHPLNIGALFILSLNDWLLKALYPSWITGKLSDFSGLYFFPSLLFLGMTWIFKWASPKPLWISAIVITAFGFTALQFSQCSEYIMHGFQPWVTLSITPDLEDLWALSILWPRYQMGLKVLCQ